MGEIFFVFILLVLIENSQGFKTFEFVKRLYYKTLSNPLIFIEELL
jgi:hypothetical protein